MINKKLLLILLPLASLTACVKDNPKETAHGAPQEIVFDHPIVAASRSKAISGSIEGTFPQSQDFKVWAFYSDGAFSRWDAPGSGQLYMDGVTVSYNPGIDDGTPGSGAWNSNPSYWWPKNGKLTFAACAPATIAASTVNYAEDGLSIHGFTVDSDPTKQIDLMYSERSFNKTESTGTNATYDGVDIVFNHALSSIKFKARANYNYGGEGAKTYITGVRLVNVDESGNFKENVRTDVQTSYSSNPAWSGHSSQKDYQATPSTLNQEIGSSIVDVESGDIDLILLPQQFDHGSAGHVKIEVTYKQGVSGETKTVTIDLVNGNDTDDDGVGDDYFYDGATRITGWEPGKRYTYTLTFGRYKILFTPTVVSWINQDNDAIEI